uniref:Uncharacterized protein n=1 Tax=Setaria viridis TaxID=4556 RepID=A0A4U6UVY7_SETVI|nr:hypothetical protein SEVIR_4G108902v2 [Setaria viridis]TKW20736.1 hypothetical protein SEVIR_4G108902v2 [Setaria viridis]TKW20737.1 hypothetical protein SEVIR_4G108902v2 [Setaria viridis]TKW20738.1 hypothetical protein SEVIR_4G108902v2 [Setaria viridis]TKW20739.1 hypothetical protein SEVIR_4G108902v2 [Setaria viridis]
MKSLHSVVPSTVPKISKPLPTAIAPENSSYPDATGSDAATSAVSPQFQSASMPHQSYAGSSAPHPHVRSMVSQLRVPSTSKMPQVQVQGTMLRNFKNIVKLQAQYSGAKNMIPISSIPLLPTGAPKSIATPKSTGELKFYQSQGLNVRKRNIDCAGLRAALKDSDNTAISTTEGQKDSILNMLPDLFT